MRLTYNVASLLDDPAHLAIALHHQDNVRLIQHIKVVCHEHACAMCKGTREDALVQEMVAHLRVESREGVVQEDNVGLGVRGSGDAYPLLLTA